MRLADIPFEETARALLYEIGLTDLELHTVYPPDERNLRILIIRKFRMVRWEQLARLLNSDTE